MEKFVNDVVVRLITKLPKENVEIVRNVLYLVLHDYEVTAKTTDLATSDNDLPKIAKIYLGIRHVDGLSDNTLRQYKRTLSKFFIMITKSVNDVTTEDCRLFLLQMQQINNMSNRSLDNQRLYLKAFFSWLLDNEYINRNPCAAIKPFKYEKKVKKEFTHMEVEKLKKACKNDYERCIVEVLYSTGCRVSELVNIRLDDMDLVKGDVFIRKGKGNKQRWTYLNPQAILAIQDYIKDRDYPSVYLFENFRKPHGQLKAAAIEKKARELAARTSIITYPHKFRRTTATHLWEKGMPIEEIQFLLGHESIDTTMEYTNVNRDRVKTDHQKYFS